jgi:hypothetical protein
VTGQRPNLDPDHRPTPQPAPPPTYRPVPGLDGLVACARCAAVVVDAAGPQATHAAHHAGLALLWHTQSGDGDR